MDTQPDGIHAMVPRETMGAAARKLRDTYARVPGVPALPARVRLLLPRRVERAGHAPGCAPGRALPLRPARQPLPGPARLVRGRLQPGVRGEGARGPRRLRGGAGLRRPARALLQGPPQRLHARVPRPPGQGHAHLGRGRQVAAGPGHRRSATSTSSSAWPRPATRRRAA